MEKGEITLHNEKEETWKVQFNTTPGSSNNLCRGWKHFCWKNNIRCGDICTLKIIAKNEILVTISKADKTVLKTIDVESDAEILDITKAVKTVETFDVKSEIETSSSH